MTSETVKEVTNNGILLTGQGAVSGTKVYNNGLIVNFVLGGQWGYEGKGIELYNSGLIVSEKAGQHFYTAAESCAVNYGIIVATGEGQHGGGNNIYNYGIIAAGSHGQTLGGIGLMKNYGTINVTGDNAEGQNTNSSTDSKDSKAYNYGLIKVINGYGMNTKGEKYNYGVIHSSDKSKVFGKIDGLGEIVNKGIVITDKQDVYSKDWAKTGVTLGADYTLKNTDAIDMVKENTLENNTLNNSSFRDKNIGYVHTNNTNSSLGISNITADRDEEGDIVNRKVLGVVAEQKSTVFTAKENLLLDGVDMTGYLINGGTFINMDNKDLILSDVNITVTEDLTKTKGEKAVAVDLGSGKLSLMGTNTINGIIKGGKDSKLEALAQKTEIETNTEGTLTFKNAENDNIKDINYTDVKLTGVKADKIETIFTHTSAGKENTIEIGESFVLGTAQDYKTETVIEETSTAGNKSNYIINNLDNIHGNIKLGAGENTVTVNKFDKYDGTIDLGAGEDKFIAHGEENGNYVFNYHVKNAETIELNGGTWGDWTNAQGTIGFDKITKAENYPKLTLGEKETKINITLGTENNGSDFAEYIAGLGEALGTNHLVIHGTGQDVSTAKYLIGADGINFDNLSTTRYSFDDKVNYKDSPILNISSDEGKGVNISVKTAGEMGLSGQHRIIYEAYLNEIKADGSVNEDVIEQLNKDFNTSEEFANHIRKTNVTGEAYYTAGNVVTMNIADTYLSGVEDFTKRAGKGEWLAQGKYINSDTEFDGGSKVKGYDGDVTGTMGMIEYGFTENTSYGVVYGQGDSEMDIDGGGKLDGDNIYAGLYMKHRTQNGIELVANLGYVENDMDSVLKNNFKVDGISGNTFEKGTADSSAVILSVKGKKDYRITDTVKVQPILGARATFINQEKAENPEMHFTIKEQDIIVVEGTAGMGIAKEFALPQGKLELNAGVEYTFAATSSTNDAEYTLFDETTVKLEDVDTAENTGTAFAGFDYEHESGVGFNGKYEMMWSDKGDDSRITAGISYRF
ncbi:MAG: autotransporter outer membrane beta-barrel domain-containing protein [Fusobacterium sp.]|nr:autotransporter outer membrane beta-barrel domain-containing protein [Fusobacterium sp.]